jgi:hypothetical protein
MNAVLDAETLLALDVGSVHTRANLFDVVDGRYRLVATGRALSTAGAPLFDISEGVRSALDQVQEITGRRIVDESEALILPATGSGSGVDVFVGTASAGPRVRTVLIGLMPGISMDSVRRLAASTYLDVVAEISLIDARREEEQIDLILAAKPDLILMAGGTDGGARDSMLRMARVLSLAVQLIPDDSRPKIVFAGNREIGATLAEMMSDIPGVVLTPNVRPSLEQEELGPTRLRLAEAIAQVRSVRVNGFEELKQWSGGYLLLAADAFGRVIRYLSQIYDPHKGVLGVDVGASHTTLAAAFAGDLRLTVRTDLGQGASLPGLLKCATLDDVTRWLPVDISDSRVKDYIYNKGLHPATIPTEKDELHLEFAVARALLRAALQEARPTWPDVRHGRVPAVLSPFERILASGGVLSRAPRPGFTALALLDALQPVGVTTMVLDPYSLAPALGAAMGAMPMASVQVLESGSFVSLGTVVAPVGRGRPGRPVLHVRLERERSRTATEGEVRYGQLAVLPLAPGDVGRLTIRPEHGFDVGFGGPGKAGTLRVAGSAVGLILDARGRPLRLAQDPGRRREANMKWLWDIGAME